MGPSLLCQAQLDAALQSIAQEAESRGVDPAEPDHFFLLEAAGTLLAAHPGCYLQTHLCENLAEIATVRRLFPWAKGYTDVYDRFGLLGMLRISDDGYDVVLPRGTHRFDRLVRPDELSAACRGAATKPTLAETTRAPGRDRAAASSSIAKASSSPTSTSSTAPSGLP